MAGLQTGHGTTLAFGTTTGFSPGYTAIGGPGWNRNTLDTSVLATTGGRPSIGGDVWTVKPIVSTYLLDPSTLATSQANSIDDLLFNKNETSTGTARASAGNNEIKLATAETYTDNELISASITLTGGTGVGQTRTVVSNVASTDTATLSRDWGTNPDATTTYSVVKDPMTVDETVTITTSNGASFAGSAHVAALEVEELSTDQLIAASLSTQFADAPTIGDGS